MTATEHSWDQISLYYLKRNRIIALFPTKRLNLELGGQIFVRATANEKTLLEIDTDIERQTKKEGRYFKSTFAVVLTYILVPTRDAHLQHTFQVVVATDGREQTFLLTNYRQLGVDSATVGINDLPCSRTTLVEISDSDTLLRRGIFGQLVEQITPYRFCRGMFFTNFL